MELLKSDVGNSTGPSGRSFRVVVDYHTYDDSTSDYYHIQRNTYIQVTAGSSTTWTTSCKPSWQDSSVSLSTAGVYAIIYQDIGWYRRGESTPSWSPSAQYTGNGGNTYKSSMSNSSYTFPTDVPSFSETPGTVLNPYFTVTDFSSRTYNSTLYDGATYDTMRKGSPTRLLYSRAIQVSKGTPVSVTCFSSNNDGATATSSSTSIYYAAMEFDANGYCVYDSGWLQMDGVWIAGEESGGQVPSGRDRSTVKWIIFLFRHGDNSNISYKSMLDITGYNMAISTYLTYTMDCNGGSIDGQNNLKYYRWDTRPTLRSTGLNSGNVAKSFVDPVRTGYRFLGWKITPAHRTAPTGLFSSETLNNYVASGNYYSFLFDDSTFTAQWEILNVAYGKQGGSYVLCNTYVKKDGIWCPAIPYSKDNGTYKQSTV